MRLLVRLGNHQPALKVQNPLVTIRELHERPDVEAALPVCYCMLWGFGIR